MEKIDKRHQNPGRPKGTKKHGDRKHHRVYWPDDVWQFYQDQGGNDWFIEFARNKNPR